MHCPHCQSPREPDARFCGECGQILYSFAEQAESGSEEPKTKIIRRRWSFWVGLTLFCSALLAGLAYLAYERMRAVAYVNGEKIYYSDWQSEVAFTKPLMESRYGSTVFQGAAGKENYKIFRYQVLESLIIERLLRQEAGKSGVVVTLEEVQSRLNSMAEKEGSSPEEFLKQAGLSRSQASRILQQELLREKLISSQLNRRGPVISDSQLYQQAGRIYLNHLWSQAQIRLVDKEFKNPAGESGGACACCGSNAGGCGSKSPQPVDPKTEAQARAAALKAYEEKYGPAQVMAAVTDYGCHIQMDIVDKGKILKSYAYREGKAEEIN